MPERSDYYWLNNNARQFLARGYLLEGVTAEDRVRQIAERAEELLQMMWRRENGDSNYPELIDNFADKFEHNMARGYYSLASPEWSNFGMDRGLPISCFGSYIGDSMEAILGTHAEVGMMTKVGGGTSGYFGDIRPRGSEITNNGTTNGTYPFAKLFDQEMNVISQGSCYVEGTKVLTSNGYKDFRDVNPAEDKIAQADKYNQITFTSEYELVEQEFTGELDVYEGLNKPETFSLKVTPNHRMVVECKKAGGWPGYTEIEKSEDLNLHGDNRMHITGVAKNQLPESLTALDQLRIAFQVDGRKDEPNRRIRFRFRKDRKIQRMQNILDELGWDYDVMDLESGTVEIKTDYVEDVKHLFFDEWVDLSEISSVWAEEFIHELAHWDGSFRKGQKDLVCYDTTDYKNAEFVSAVCALAGKRARIVKKADRPGNGKAIYRVNIRNQQYRGGDSITQTKEEYDGTVHCAIVPTGRLVVQHNGVSAICGNTRRGYFAGYIPIEHGDIEEWLNIQLPGDAIQDMMYAVTVGDEWMREMIAGDSKKRNIWAKVIKNRSGEIGVPYIMFRDNVNSNKPQVYKDKNKEIYASNLCLAGDQRVVTDEGYKKAEDLYKEGGKLTLFDGNKPIGSSRMKLRQKDADVYKFKLGNGLEQKVTAEHGMPVYEGKGKYKRVEAQNVEVGDRIVIQKKKGLFGSVHRPREAFLAGLYQSDGTQAGERTFIDVWEDNFDLLDEIESAVDYVYNTCGLNVYEPHNQNGPTGSARGRKTPQFHNCTATQGGVAKKSLGSTKLRQAIGVEKGSVPDWMWEADEETQWEYVRGLLYADGSAHMSSSNGNPIQIAYADIKHDFLQELQLLFNNLGLASQIRVLHEAGPCMMPDGKGGQKEYHRSKSWRLVMGIKANALEIEKHTGFLTRKGVDVEDRNYRDNSKKAYAVTEIEYVGKEDVYCPTTETKESVFISQGALTFNCSEICLPSGPDESFVCCLASINASRYDEWKDTNAVEVLTYYLDAVMEEFIQKASDIQYLDRAVNFAKRQRALGIGVLGWHTKLQQDNIPFDSMEASLLNAELFKDIKQKSYSASEDMASHFGEPSLMKGYGRRNATTMAVAPTKSSSYILGQVSQGIEPVKANYFVRDAAKKQSTFKNPRLESLLEKKGKNDRATWRQIKKDQGSVQNLDCLTDREKDVFRTFGEIPQLSVIKQAAQRQQWIDQSQSLNLAIDPKEVSAKDINQLYIQAWEMGVKTLYYQKSSNAAQQFAANHMECRACGS